MIPRICGKLEKHWYHFSDWETCKGCISLEGEIMSLAFIIKNKMSTEYQT